MKTYRQGDVFIIESNRIGGLKKIEREGGRIILAHGEVTGHAHAIAGRSAEFALNEQTLQRYLDVSRPVELRHEEHAKIKLPSGFYEVRIQREYEQGWVSNVAD